MKFEAEGRELERGSWRWGSKLMGLRKCSKLPQLGLGAELRGVWGGAPYGAENRLQMHFGCTYSPESTSIVALRSHKCYLVSVSRFDLAEPFDAIGGTLRFCRTPVEKHWVIIHSLTSPVVEDITVHLLSCFCESVVTNHLHVF